MHATPQQPGQIADAPRRVLFSRGRHRWSLECDTPGRGELLRWVAWCAEQPAYALDRFDAAVIATHFLRPGEPQGLKPEAREAD
ncbi:MAG: hypothetical protein WD749_14035 [Phycisphaerales bacterium]